MKIGIQFLKNSISIAYYHKNKFLTRTISFDEDSNENNIHEHLENLFKQTSISNVKKHKVILSIPSDLVEVNTVKEIVNIGKIKNLQMYVQHEAERIIEKYPPEYQIDVAIDKDMKKSDKIMVSIVSTRKETCINYLKKIKKVKNLEVIAIEPEFQALRRIIDSNIKNVVIINFFKNVNDLVGIYVYKDKFLLATRYLVCKLYDPVSIVKEIDRILTYCKTIYRDYVGEKYYIFGTKEDVENMNAVMQFEEHDLQNSVNAVSIGLSLKDNKIGGTKYGI